MTVDLNGHPSLRARIGFQEVSRTLTGAEFEDLIARFAALPVSGLPLGEPMGVDGVIYRLTVSSAAGTVEYSWWCDIPKGWEAAERLANRLASLTGLKASSYQP